MTGKQLLRLRWIALGVILGAVLSTLTPSVGFAKVVMKRNFKQFVPVKILTAASTSTALAGDAFEVRIIDDVVYQDKRLPAGSTLKGRILETREPKRWGRPARFKVTFDQLSLGFQDADAATPLPAHEDSDKQYQTVFLENYRNTGKSMISRQTAIGLVANAITVPISLLTKHGALGAYILDDAVDGTVGMIEELRHKDVNDTRSAPRKAVIGFVRGTTPIPLIVGLVRKGKTLAYQADATTYCLLPKKLMQDIFINKNTANAVSLSVSSRVQKTAEGEATAP